MTIDRAQFDKTFAVLRARFAVRLVEYADRLERSLANDQADQAHIADLIHRISGTAGSFGFSDVSAAAAPLDQQFSEGVAPLERREQLEALVLRLRAQAAAQG